MTIPQSIRKFCKDDYTKIENYELAKADNFKDWCIHHRLELTLDNEYAHSRADLIRPGKLVVGNYNLMKNTRTNYLNQCKEI